MRKLKFMTVILFLIFAISACRNTENEQRYASVDAYEAYVDSISNVGMRDLDNQWDDIESTIQDRRDKAEAEMQSISDDDEIKARYQQKIYATSVRYDDFRDRVLSERERNQSNTNNASLRKSLFENVTVGNDRNFDWVNKDNIHDVYDHFVTTVSNNKDDYTREEWDEIKMLYESLDSRKNTVENEGLSAEDNRKIAALKVKFAPMYQMNRLEAKNEENKESKNQ